MRSIHRSTVVLVAGLIAASFPTLAHGDAAQHSQHIELTPVGDAPLRSGFLQNIHAQGPQVYGHEIYVLNGAVPEATFDVTLYAYPFAPDCTGDLGGVIATATFETNRVGNGQARVTVYPNDVSDFPRGTHGVIWTVSGGGHMYTTACTAVTLD